MLHTVSGVAQLLSATPQEKLGASSVRTARHGCVCRASLQHSERSGSRMTERLNNTVCVSSVNQEAWKNHKSIVEHAGCILSRCQKGRDVSPRNEFTRIPSNSEAALAPLTRKSVPHAASDWSRDVPTWSLALSSGTICIAMRCNSMSYDVMCCQLRHAMLWMAMSCHVTT